MQRKTSFASSSLSKSRRHEREHHMMDNGEKKNTAKYRQSGFAVMLMFRSTSQRLRVEEKGGILKGLIYYWLKYAFQCHKS